MGDNARTTPSLDARDAEGVRAAREHVIQRLVEEVMNAGRLDVLDELYTPQMAAAARRWIAPFPGYFPRCTWRR